MAFFENLGKKVGEAAQAAAKKSNELMEVTKINMSITKEEDKIKKLYMGMGEKIYEGHRSNPEEYPQFAEECESIDTCRENIKKFKARILDMKSLKLCSECGEEISKSVQFCSKCGAKQEPVEEEIPQEEPAGRECPSCGAQIDEDCTFCTSCGSKVEE